ncbi:MAG: dihydropteroate synthase [Ignavibacterium sp.]|nr:dihydropteroate synthase [Ignavibacterium sp.]MDW8374334.1 dihydropteroate synthase [Ignavibacteriales bacterium]
MIAHIIKVSESILSFIKKKYNLENLFHFDELVEIRSLNNFEYDNLIHLLRINNIPFYPRDNKIENDKSILITDNVYNLLNIIETKNFNKLNELDLLKSFLKNYLGRNETIYKIGDELFNFQKAYLMGILNVTPDSFSDGGKYLSINDAIKRATEMIEQGVDIIDIGGESSRPGSDFISEDEEKRRVLPVIEKLLKLKSDLIISVDTTKSSVAKASLDLGVKIINDISAMTLDSNMFSVCKEKNATIVLMHMQGTPKTMQLNPQYSEVVSDIFDYLHNRVIQAKNVGIQNIIIDPGIGFGKSVEDNFTIIKRLKEFSSIGCPILIGLSRKSFIGKTLNLDIESRDFPTAILETISLINSARIIRTHNVKNGRMLVDLINKIL